MQGLSLGGRTAARLTDAGGAAQGALKSFLKKFAEICKFASFDTSNSIKGVKPVMTAQSMRPNDRETLTRLIRTYEKDLLRMCCIYLHDVTQAEDAVQETFLKAYKSMHTFRGESAERTWLIRIAINTCRDMKRTSWYRLREMAVDWERLKMPMEHEADTKIALTTAIMKLPDKYKEVVYLHFYEDLNVGEAAAVLGCSSATVCRRIDKATRLLRKELDAQGGERHA